MRLPGSTEDHASERHGQGREKARRPGRIEWHRSCSDGCSMFRASRLASRYSIRVLTSAAMLGALSITPILTAGCVADADEDAGETEGNVAAALKARRQLSFSCPQGKAGIKVAFFDADSTLRVSKQNGVTANAVDDVDVLPFAATTIKGLNKQGYLVAIVSNQGGVSVGKTTFEVAEGALLTTAKKLGQLGACVNYIDFAEAEDENRKPETGMADRLDETLKQRCGRGIDFAQSSMTGDSAYKKDSDGPSPDGRAADDFSNSDRLFAENAGLGFIEPKDAFGWRQFNVYNVTGERELLPFLDAISKTAAAYRTNGNAEQADALDAEVAANRKVNGLPAAAE